MIQIKKRRDFAKIGNNKYGHSKDVILLVKNTTGYNRVLLHINENQLWFIKFELEELIN